MTLGNQPGRSTLNKSGGVEETRGGGGGRWGCRNRRVAPPGVSLLVPHTHAQYSELYIIINKDNTEFDFSCFFIELEGLYPSLFLI